MADKMWACWGSAGGLFFKQPRDVKKDPDIGAWWTSCGNYKVDRKGLEVKGSSVYFAHESHAEVKKFMRGYKACHDVIKTSLGA